VPKEKTVTDLAVEQMAVSTASEQIVLWKLPLKDLREMAGNMRGDAHSRISAQRELARRKGWK
jgi:hypothetical protein